MAVDDVLLTAAVETGQATLRFYRWAEPTLSLGYFQAYEARAQHAPSRPCAVVRRSSGGGAILHDRELTYSLAAPTGFRPPRDHQRLYVVVHDLLCEALAALGIGGARRCGLHGNTDGRRKDSPPTETIGGSRRLEPFLCFERRTEHDVVLGDVKIAGSAQRKRRGAVLQHGSVLLERSEHAPSLPGIRQAAGVEVSLAALIDAWQRTLSDGLGWRFQAAEHSQRTSVEALRAANEKFATEAWLRRR
jgi:lipoate-protein ligase A